MGVVTKSIGTAGGRDYSTLQAWEDALPANLVTDGNSQVGECYNDSAFSSTTARLTISGETTSSTFTITLKCASGQSFRDNGSVRSNALAYSAANGVGIASTNTYTTTITVGVSNVFFHGLQIQAADGTLGRCIDQSGVAVRYDNCILSGRELIRADAAGSSVTAVNCLFHVRGAGKVDSGASPWGGSSGAHRLEYCTIVRGTAGGTLLTSAAPATVLENCFLGNATTALATSGSGTFTGSDYNATTSASLPTGTHNQVGLTYSSQVENTASDWRAKSGGALANNGTPATSYASDDISATARSASTPTIGAWELAAAGGGSVFTPYFWQAHIAGFPS